MPLLTDNLISLWTRMWYRERQAEDLALWRISFYSMLFLLNTATDFSALGSVSQSFWHPVPLFRFLHVPLLGRTTVGILATVWRASLLTSTIGLATTSSTQLAFVLGFYLIGLQHQFGKVDHNMLLPIIMLGILAASRCGDALSIDAMRNRKNTEIRIPRGAYHWPLQLSQSVFLLAFFSAGLYKLRVSGLGWITAANMQNFLRLHQLTYPTPFGRLVASSNAFCWLAVRLVLILELSAVFAIFRSKCRLPILLGLALMQMTIRLTTGLVFDSYCICYLSFLRWPSLRSRLSRRPSLSLATEAS
jgi:hypothetical protein